MSVRRRKCLIPGNQIGSAGKHKAALHSLSHLIAGFATYEGVKAAFLGGRGIVCCIALLAHVKQA